MKELKVKLTFTEPILGTSPANPEIFIGEIEKLLASQSKSKRKEDAQDE